MIFKSYVVGNRIAGMDQDDDDDDDDSININLNIKSKDHSNLDNSWAKNNFLRSRA